MEQTVEVGQPGKAGFRRYRRQIGLCSAADLMDDTRERQRDAAKALREFAEDLNRLDVGFKGAQRLAVFEFIRRHRPYAFVRYIGEQHFCLVDRSYEDMTGLTFSQADLDELGMQAWRSCQQTQTKWTDDGFPVIDDSFSMDWLSEGAGLVQAIADLMDERLGEKMREQ
jgi:hypothetical protein